MDPTTSRVHAPETRLDALDRELISLTNEKPETSQQARKAGFVFLSALACGLAYIFEGIRTLGGVRSPFNKPPEAALLQRAWNSKPIPPPAASRIKEIVGEIKKINEREVQPPERSKIYKQIIDSNAHYGNLFTSVDNGNRNMRDFLSGVSALQDFHNKA